MGGRRRLKAGAVRLLGRFDGAAGRALRRAVAALAQAFDLATPLARLECELGGPFMGPPGSLAAGPRGPEASRWREKQGVAGGTTRQNRQNPLIQMQDLEELYKLIVAAKAKL